MSRAHYRMLPRSFLTALVAIAAVSGWSEPAHGQIFDRIKQKIKDRTDAATDSLTDLAIDKATGAVKCLATNIACIKKAFGAGKNVKIVDANGNAVSAEDSTKAVDAAGGVPANVAANAAAASAASPTSPATPPGGSQGGAATLGEGVLVNYDFVPGDRVIFAEDFTKANVGDFPPRLQLKSGTFEVAEWQGQRFLRATSGGRFIVPLPEALPKRFTFEADYNTQSTSYWGFKVDFDTTGDDRTIAEFSPNHGGLTQGGVNSETDVPDAAVRPITHVAIMADGNHVKAYINGVRVANVPNAKIGHGRAIAIDATAEQDAPAYFTNIRVAEGGKPLYDALLANGRVSTHGILFDLGSDRLRAESKPTLDLIGQMLQQHADLKLSIEGHTDNTGNAASNQTLSEKRAAAVRQFLIANYQIDASRLTSKGFGATKPVASNDTPEGRQQNRRVDLVKM